MLQLFGFILGCLIYMGFGVLWYQIVTFIGRIINFYRLGHLAYSAFKAVF
ncbi:MAG: hypothetical protein K0S04_2404 [Herbinix sp.]|jgi:hypothetical protein|nr:hypothetical protein [Herbinix sp.]